MKQFIDKLIERLEELQKLNYEAYETVQWNNDKIMYINASNAYANAITEVNQLAEEYATDINVASNGWIPCSERLPEEEDVYIVQRKAGVTFDVFRINEKRFSNRDVIAWQTLPAPYQPKGE